MRLVKATVDQLLKEGQTVTLEAICARSPEVDPEGKGIKKAAVIGNADAHAYYRKHSMSYRSGRGQQRRKGRQLISWIACSPSSKSWVRHGNNLLPFSSRFLI